MLVFFLLVSCASVFVNAQVTDDTVKHCPHGMKLLVNEDICVEYHPELLDFQAAQDACKGDGGDLVMIRSAEIGQEITDLMGATEDIDVWIGISRETESDVFNFVDGSDLDSVHKPFAADATTDTHCITRKEQAAFVQWHNKVCGDAFGYICQTKAVKCKKNWTPDFSGSVCFKVVKQFKKPYAKASEYCKKSEATLPTGDLMRKEMIRKMSRKARGKMAWVGIIDPGTNFQWEFDGAATAITICFRAFHF